MRINYFYWGLDSDSVTALQMAEFQQVVDNLHRQVLPSSNLQPPPPYPYKGEPELDSIFVSSTMFPHIVSTGAPHTFQPQANKCGNILKAGCQSLPANGLLPQNMIERVQQKYPNQR